MKTEQFKHGNLILGDSLEYLKQMPNNSVDLVLTDPPYFYKELGNKELKKDKKGLYGRILGLNTGLQNIKSNEGINYKAYFKEWLRVLKDPNIVVYCNDQQIKDYLDLCYENELKFKFIIMHKLNPLPANHPYANDIEFCIYIYDPKKPFKNYTGDRASQVYSYLIGGAMKDNVKWHPSPKPLEQAIQMIDKHSDKGQVVLDCFSGSGTTAMACAMEDRNFIAIEKNETYFNKSIPRIREKDNLISFDFGE